MLWLEVKYISLLSSRLRNFSRKEQFLWNFSCPVCGDSTTNQRKARGFVYEKDGSLRFYCHNCSAGRPFRKFLQHIDPDLYREYLFESFSGEKTPNPEEKILSLVKETRRPEGNPLDGLLRVSDLPSGHPAAKLLSDRQVHPDRWTGLYHSDDFQTWANRLVPDKYKGSGESRLVIPFLDKNKRLIGFQGRSYDPSGIRYLTVCLDKEAPFLYGWDSVDTTRPIIAVEGPFDSMFVTNGIATAGSSITRELGRTGVHQDLFVVAYDNEPRNEQVVGNMRKAIKAGYKVFVWPESVCEKDLNDLAITLARTSKRPAAIVSHITSMILDNSHDGLYADMMITQWRRCAA